MTRSLAISENSWLELADELAKQGATPTTRAVAALAKERFGLSASFTTIQQHLETWQRLGGLNRPTTGSPEMASLVLHTIEPLYQQLLDNAKAKFEPLLVEAEKRANDAEAARQAQDTEVLTLRQSRDELQQRYEALTAEHATLSNRSAALDATNQSAQRRNEDLQREIAVTQADNTALRSASTDQERAHRQDREQLLTSHASELAHLRDDHQLALATQKEQLTALLFAAREEASTASRQYEDALEVRRTLQAELATTREQLQVRSAEYSVLQAELNQQREQNVVLRATDDTLTAQLQTTTARFTEERADYRARIEALETQHVLLLKTRTQEDARYDAIAQSIKQLKVRP